MLERLVAAGMSRRSLATVRTSARSPQAGAGWPIALRRRPIALTTGQVAPLQGELGVTACDALAEHLLHCALTLQREQADLLFNLIDELRAAWRQSVGGPNGALLLTKMCNSVRPMVGNLIQQFGCR